MRRRLRQLIAALWLCAMLGCLAMVGGAYINDRAIAADPGRALARVMSVGRMRTTVEYRDESGLYHAPEAGVLYPTGLHEGQQVWVSYARTRPELVKVEGRAWTLSVIPAASVAVVSTGIAAAAWWGAARGSFTGISRRRHRGDESVGEDG